MPNFNYGKPRGSPTALSLLIAPVSKLCRLHVEQRGGECPTMCVWEFIFCVSLRAAFLKCFVPLPVITKRGYFFFCQAFSGGWSSTAARMAKKEMKKKKRALSAWLHLRCRAQRCILWSLSSHSEGSIIWGAWNIMNGWYSTEDETPWEREGGKGSLGMRRQENRLWRECLTEEI